MSDNDVAKMAEALSAVMTALQPLSAEERSRVIQSVTALFGTTALPSPTIAVNPGPGNLGAPSVASRASTGKPMSLVEFIKEKMPATNTQRIACFAYFREKYEGTEYFSSSDLMAYFGKAKLTAPKNYPRDYGNAVKEAWIHDEGAQSYLTQDGETAVDTGFAGRGKPRGPSVGKRKKKPSKAAE